LKKTNKLISLEDAVKLINNNSRVALGGFGIYQRPMAFVREMINQKIKNLTIVGVVNSIESDILIGSNCISSIETSYVGFEKYGIAPNFRKYSEKGKLKIINYPELLSIDRFRASQENLDFWPASGLGGTDIVKLNTNIKSFIKQKQSLDGGRIGQALDLDGAATYFMSDKSIFTTGQVLSVDGGWSVNG